MHPVRSLSGGGDARSTALAEPPTPSRQFLIVGLCMLLFIAYGSLVPLNFQPLPLATAWDRFLYVPYLDISLKHREDFVANILLYIPVGLCLTAALGGPRGEHRFLAGAVVLAIGTTAGTAIEFTQLFFPPRTVSINDMVANVVGTLIGIALWWGTGRHLIGLIAAMQRGGPRAIRALAVAYVLAYFILSLFPFDFLMTLDELRWKVDQGMYGLLVARGACEGAVPCGIKLAAEVAAVLPLGMLLGSLWGPRVRGTRVRALIIGSVLGAAIEFAQFFVVSGVSQGASIVTRGVGMAMGVAVMPALGDAERLRRWRLLLRPAVVLAVVPYLLVVLLLSGWHLGPLSVGAAAWERMAELRFIPFYYHYYVSESAALQSVLSVGTLFFPIGVAFWCWQVGGPRAMPGRATAAVCTGVLLAAIVGIGKLMLPDRRPDPTDLLIVGVAVWLGHAIATALWRWAREAASPRPAVPVGVTAMATEPAHTSGDTVVLVRLVSFAPALLAAALLAVHPAGLWLAPPLVALACLLWHRPYAAVPIAMACLPVFDLARWTGWFYVDEFDALLLVSTAMLLWRLPVQAWNWTRQGLSPWLLVGLGSSWAISTAIGLWPLQPWDGNAFSTYLSHYNALRVAKGFAWAVVLAPPTVHLLRTRAGGQRALALGMLAGLAGVVAVALWERFVFMGLFDFVSDHRITATFSAMHTGGAFVEAYLLLAMPFLAVAYALYRGVVARTLVLVLFVLGSYALMVTFARGGYLGYVLALAVLAWAAWAHARARSRAGERSSMVVPALMAVLLGGAVAYPVLEGSYMQGRWGATRSDADIRTRHWSEVVGMMDGGGVGTLFGMGLGRLPETFYFHSPSDTTLPSFSYVEEGGGAHLTLGGGPQLFVGQWFGTEYAGAYVLELDVRSATPGAQLDVGFCQKSLLYSHGCTWVHAKVAQPGAWEHHRIAFTAVAQGERALLPRTVHLALGFAQGGARIDVDNIRLLDASGRDRIRNGTFSAGHDHWTFSSDDHLRWHAKNLAVQVLFDQGVYGLLVSAAVVTLALARSAGAAARGDRFAGTLLASLVGFLTVGLFDSLVDAPRIAMVFFLLLFLSVALPGRRPHPTP